MAGRIKHKKSVILLAELVLLTLYAVYAFHSYSVTDITYTENDMTLQNVGGGAGYYVDASYEGERAVTTPAFSLHKGVYDISGVYQGKGILQAGLIYDQSRNGAEKAEGNEFSLSPEKTAFRYRVSVKDDSPLRFRIRLTAEAEDGDYAMLQNVRIVSSALTWVYAVAVAFLFLVVLDLLCYGYGRYKTLNVEQRMVCLVLIVTAFLAGLPLYRPGLTDAHDLSFHLQRIAGLSQGLYMGQFPVRIQPGWLNGYGYPVSVFYGDILLYFPALLRMVGFTLQEAYKCYVTLINVATVSIAFYAFRRVVRDDMAAMVGAVLYTCGSVRLATIYGFGAMCGAYSAMTFYPLIAAGFYLLFTGDVASEEYKGLWKFLTIGFSGVLLTHMISCLLVGFFSLLACLTMWKRVFRRGTFAALCKAAGAAVCLNLWFLVPFLQYMATEELRINRNLGTFAPVTDYYAEMADYAQDGQSLYQMLAEHTSLGVTTALVLLLYLFIRAYRQEGKNWKTCSYTFGYTLFVMWWCMDFFPVEELARRSRLFLKFFQTIQYQNRICYVAAVLAAMLGAQILAPGILDKKFRYLLAGVLCCINLSQNIEYFRTLPPPDKTYLDEIDLVDSRSNDYAVGNGEYIPVATDIGQLTGEIRADGLEIEDVEREYLTFEMTVRNPADQDGSILLPLISYEGYRTMDEQSGDELSTKAGENGQVEVIVPPGYAGRIRTTLYEPWFWRLAEWISLLSFAAICYGELRHRDRIPAIKNQLRFWKKGEMKRGD